MSNEINTVPYTTADKEAAFARILAYAPLCYPEAAEPLLVEIAYLERIGKEKDERIAELESK